MGKRGGLTGRRKKGKRNERRDWWQSGREERDRKW